MNFWDHMTKDGNTYQMGEQIHRIYLLNLLKKLQIKSFLDVGCGTAPLYEILLKSPLTTYYPISDYKGVDYSHGMIKVCKKEFPQGDFEVQDARFLSEKDNSWDAVVLMHCLDHLDDYQAAIKEASRVSRKYIVIILWRPLTEIDNNLNSSNTIDRERGQWDDTHLQEYSLSNLLKVFENAHLKLEIEYAGKDLNTENTHNRLFLLKKYD